MKHILPVTVLICSCFLILFASCVSVPAANDSSAGSAGTKPVTSISEMTLEQLNSELRDEVSYGRDKDRISALLEAGADPNTEGVAYEIRWLIFHDNFEAARMLFDYGLDPNFRRDRDGRTFAHIIDLEGRKHRKSEGNKERFEFILSCGVRLDTIDNDGNSPLMFWAGRSIEGGIVEILNLILDWEEEHSPEFCANYKNRNDYLSEVLRRYINLSISYTGIDNQFIERLLNAGADAHTRDEEGVLIVFRQQSYSSTIHIDSLPLFIERGIPINETDRGTGLFRGRTLLHYAIRQNKKGDVIKMLLENGADPNIKEQDNNYGYTALINAHSLRSLDIVELLLLHGADPLIKDNKGNTVLHHWAENEQYRTNDRQRMFELFLEHGCPVDVVNNEGQTPLMLAFKGHSSISDIFAILEKGADVNHKDNNGNNVFYYFAKRSFERGFGYSTTEDYDMMLAQALLERGAIPTEKNNEGDSALIYLFRVSKYSRGKPLEPVRILLMNYASDDEIKTAKDAIPREERAIGKLSSFATNVLPYLVLPAVSITTFAAYSGNREANFMGPVNSVLTYTALWGSVGSIVTFLFYLPQFFWPGHTIEGLHFWVGASFVGGFIYGVIKTASDASVRREFNTNPALYFIPSVISLILITIEF